MHIGDLIGLNNVAGTAAGDSERINYAGKADEPVVLIDSYLLLAADQQIAIGQDFDHGHRDRSGKVVGTGICALIGQATGR